MRPKTLSAGLGFRPFLDGHARVSAVCLLCALTGFLTGGLERAWAEDWPQLLGPARDGSYTDVSLSRSWEPLGARVLWKSKVGEGFAGPIVTDGKLILFHRLRNQEVIAALDPKTGERLWSHAYLSNYRDQFGFNAGPRATPTAADGRLFTVGADGRLTALQVADGRLLWSVALRQRFKGEQGFFGAACAPLVVGEKVLVNVGGADGAGVVAFQAETGEVLWKATGDEAGYSSPILARIGGETVVLTLTREGLVMLDPENGRVLLEQPFRSRLRASVTAALPVVVGDRVFLSASYGTGAALFRLARKEGSWWAQPLWGSTEVLSNHYATSIEHGGYLYGVHGRVEARPSLRAVSVATGKVVWSEERFGGATVLRAGSDLLILRENGELLLVPATPDGFKPVTRGRLLVGKVFAYPALSEGVLYARSDQGLLVAVDLREGAGEAP